MKVLFLLFTLFLFGCSNVYMLSEERLNKETSKGKTLKLTYSELPEAVRDTIQGTFEWFREVNLHTKSTEPTVYYPRMVSLDTTLRFQDHIYNGSFEKEVMSRRLYQNGEYFTIGEQRFRIPMDDSSLRLKIIYKGKLYLMGDSSGIEISYKDSDAHTVQYTLYRYWVVDLNNN